MTSSTQISHRRPRPLRDQEFGMLTSFIRSVSGIQLSSAKKALVEGRLRGRLSALGLQSFSDYYLLLAEDDGSECQIMLDRITTNETSFFRELAHFDLIENVLIPKWRRDAEAYGRSRHVRVWSAACSTGEEPYSVAMSLYNGLPRSEGWTFEIVASDLSTEVLEHAARGVYSIDQVSGILPQYRKQFVLKGRGAQAGKMMMSPELKSQIKFGRFNLNASRYAFQLPFDLILCRNVLIYFGRDEKMGVINRLLNLLTKDGLLMLGHSESLQGQTDRVRCVKPTVYALRGDS